MWPFNRKKSLSSQGYKTERMWLVWLLSILTFVATVLIVLALFWAGRWSWRRLSGKPKTPTVTVQKPRNDDTKKAEPTKPSSNSTPSTGNTNNTPSASGNNSTAPPTTPATGSTAPLPNTGPTYEE